MTPPCFLTAAARVLWAAAFGLLVAAPSAAAQPLTWESFPAYRHLDGRSEEFSNVGFLSGSASSDSIAVVHRLEVLRWAPGQDNNGDGVIDGFDSDWRKLAPPTCRARNKGFFTSQHAILTDNSNICRSPDSGATWQEDVAGPGHAADAFFEARYPVPGQPEGAGALVMAAATASTRRSFGDAAPGTWETEDRNVGGWIEAFGEVPPSAALPTGRLLAAVWNGVTASTDGGLTWQPTSLYDVQSMIAYEFAFVPTLGHSYGGVAFAGVDVFPGEELTVWRSDDGGATWTEAYEFDAAAWEMDNIDEIRLFAGPDGALYAGIVDSIPGPLNDHGRIARSYDLGATWEAADGGMRVLESGTAPGTNAFALSPDGRLYAATDSLLWRTTAPLPVAADERASLGSTLGVSVRPNPSAGGTVRVEVSVAAPSEVRAYVLDALGRRVADVLAGAVSGTRSVEVDTAGWAAGVYSFVVEVSASRLAEAEGTRVVKAFTVAR